MTVYVVMIADRHTDPEPELFADRDAAIAYARRVAFEAAQRPGRELEEHDPPPVGWLYYATYSVEDDAVWVLAKELHGAAVEAAARTTTT